MAQRLEGKVALITGGASGIGRQMALLFAREGAKVVVADLNEAGSSQTVKLVEAEGGQAHAVELNVVEPAQVQVAVETTVKRFGSLDVLCNNAGTGENTTSILELDDAEWDRVMAVNVKGVFLGIKYGAAEMIRAGKGGSIINTASIAGIKGFALHSAYASSKAACLHLTRTAALELARHRIRVNALAPAFTDTPMVDQLVASSRDPEQARRKLAAVIPLGRLGTPEEIAQAAVFLASNESSFVTGAVLTLDGGATAQ